MFRQRKTVPYINPTYVRTISKQVFLIKCFEFIFMIFGNGHTAKRIFERCSSISQSFISSYVQLVVIYTDINYVLTYQQNMFAEKIERRLCHCATHDVKFSLFWHSLPSALVFLANLTQQPHFSHSREMHKTIASSCFKIVKL